MNRRHFLAQTAAAAVLTAGAAQGPARESSKRYRACVIGDSGRGRYGHDLHLVWTLRDDVDVVALADPDESGRAEHARQAGAERLYADYREMLDKERPDLVAIGPRWTIHHKEYLLACAEAGAHGIIEKPLTPDLAEADEVLAAMDAKNLKWSIAFNFRASREIAHARKMLFEEKLIGDILEVRARGKEDRRSGGEDLVVLGIHLFDTMIHFLGRPTGCAARILVDGRPATAVDVREATESLGPIVGDTIHAMFEFPGGIPGYFASVKNTENFPGRWGINVYGTQGIATMRMGPVPQVAYIEEPSWAPAGKDSVWKRLPDSPNVEAREPAKVAHYAPIIDDLINAIAEDRQPAVSLRDGLNATEMIQAVFEAPLHGGRVAMPLEQRTHPLLRW